MGHGLFVTDLWQLDAKCGTRAEAARTASAGAEPCLAVRGLRGAAEAHDREVSSAVDEFDVQLEANAGLAVERRA